MQLVLPKGKVRLFRVPVYLYGIAIYAPLLSFLEPICLGMKIFINDEPHDVAEAATLAHIVFGRLGEKQKGIAVAVNNNVIARQERESYVLQTGDHVLIIKATQGG
ncbi:sulfur carrier protein ThiS [Taibaiella koreensis]|uniref:sulfur carrier protein ThiS n=1 Tax=Taibaiella koreensis TaxID=1268548 RepID=UPI001968F378|nr:sulfur carrier protein ThiS [Taibaiella koreensis]